MNLFQKYGIKEVADVVFYTITRIEDEEFYTPALYLDTLKISNLDQSVQDVVNRGGKTNRKVIGWNFNKDIKLKLEDALFSPATMSLIWGGKFNAKLSLYLDTIYRCNIANKYGRMNYSYKAKKSPQLGAAAWELIFDCAQEENISQYELPVKYIYEEDSDNSYVAENRKIMVECYYKRTRKGENGDYKAMNKKIINNLMNRINRLSQIETIDSDINSIPYIDRMEKCIVKDRNGFEISAAAQRNSLRKLIDDCTTESFTIYYDPKTMLPLFHLEGSYNDGFDTDTTFKLKKGTIYYKWTRTVDSEDENTTIGRNLTIDTNTFPDEYKIVGETYVREQKTGKDQRYQFTINRARIKTNTSVELKADGDPVVFSMELDVMNRYNENMIELCQYEVEEDKNEGGFRIIPQRTQWTYTPSDLEESSVDIENEEIY